MIIFAPSVVRNTKKVQGCGCNRVVTAVASDIRDLRFLSYQHKLSLLTSEKTKMKTEKKQGSASNTKNVLHHS